MLKYSLVLTFVVATISCAVDKKVMTAKTYSRKLSESEKERYITSSIYYIPTYTEKDHVCPASQQVYIKDRYGDVLVKSCRKVYRSCLMQGTCIVLTKDSKGNRARMMLNVDQKHELGMRSFKDVSGYACKYGMGAATDRSYSYKMMCLEPFYSVAADLSIYHLGDVIYIPHLVGIKLPTGEKHDGYVIVRDTGEAIRGKGRFDFFVGFHSVFSNNPFHKAGLSGGVHHPEYYVIQGEKAEAIRRKRNFSALKRYPTQNTLASRH